MRDQCTPELRGEQSGTGVSTCVLIGVSFLWGTYSVTLRLIYADKGTMIRCCKCVKASGMYTAKERAPCIRMYTVAIGAGQRVCVRRQDTRRRGCSEH